MGDQATNDGNGPDLRWLIGGALLGLLVAAAGILRQEEPRGTLPGGAVARVNDALLMQEVLDSAVSRLGADPASADDRARVLERLIDDELLVQRAVELGMLQTDLTVRNAIVDSLIASVTAEADAANPTDEELGQYLSDNSERFSYVARLSVGAWQSDDEAIAQDFVRRLRVTGVAPAIDGVVPVTGLAPGLASIEDLRGYLGPGVTAAAADMPAGSSAVFARRGRWLVVNVLEKEMQAVTELDDVRSRVLLDYRRDLARRALEDYIDGLASRADVTVVKP